MNCIDPAGGCSREDIGDIEIALAARGLANADGFISKLNLQRIAIHWAVNSHCGDIQLSAATQNSEGNFAAVGDQHLAECHPAVIRLWADRISAPCQATLQNVGPLAGMILDRRSPRG